MPDKTTFDFGTFCWFNLTTTDREGAQKFYGEVLGWTFEDLSNEGPLYYTMCHVDGKAVAGMLPTHGSPPSWSSYVCVEDVHAMTEKIRMAGGSILTEPTTVMESGSIAHVKDPTGAVLGLWQPNQHKGMAVVEEPGALLWMELNTRDVGAAQQFYTQIFGWQTEIDTHNQDYTLFTRTGVPEQEKFIGGMMQILTDWGDVPSHWIPYLGVVDIEVAVTKAQALGGQKHVGIVDIPQGRFAIMCDPQGAALTLMQATVDV